MTGPEKSGLSGLHTQPLRDGQLIKLAVLLFAASQLLEFLTLMLMDRPYAGMCNWDCLWYSHTVEHGYDLEPHGQQYGHAKGDAANWAFFPLFPILAMAVERISPIALWSAPVLTSKLCFLAAIFAFMKFAQAYSPRTPSALAGAVLVCNPYSLYANAGYTEPLFLFLTCTSLYQLKARRYEASGAFAALVTGTRLVGISLAFSYALTVWQDMRAQRSIPWQKVILGALLIPLGLVLFMVFLHFRVGDALAFSHVQRAWMREPGNPLVHLIEGFTVGVPLFALWATMTCAALAGTVVLACQRRMELAVFSALCTLIPLSTALWSIPRYLWWQAPLLLLVAELISRRKAWMAALPLGLAGLVYMYAGWFSGHWFVT
jgi:hypothetical protein